MKLLLWAFFILVLAIGAIWLGNHPGIVTFDWFGYHIETTPLLFCAILLLVFILIASLYKLFAYIIDLPARWRRSSHEKKLQIGLKSLTQSIVSLAAGDGKEAMTYAQNVRQYLPNNPLADFLAAKAAYIQGNDEDAKAFLQSLSNQKETALLGIKGLMSYAQKEHNKSLVIHLAQKAYRLKENAPWVLSILFDQAIMQKNWSDAFQLAQKFNLYHLWDSQEYARKRALLFLCQAKEMGNRGKKEIALDDAWRAYKLAPEHIGVILGLVELLIACNDNKKARKIIKKIWEHKPHPDLAKGFDKTLALKNPADKIKEIEDLIKLNPQHPEGQYYLAQTYLNQHLWGKAREILEPFTLINPTKEVAILMSQLEELEYHHHDLANHWLKKANEAPVSEHWECNSCQTILPSWTPICKECQSFDSIQWTKTETLQPLLLQNPDSPFTVIDLPLALKHEDKNV